MQDVESDNENVDGIAVTPDPDPASSGSTIAKCCMIPKCLVREVKK